MTLIIQDPVKGQYILSGNQVSYNGTGTIIWDDSKQGPVPADVLATAQAAMATTAATDLSAAITEATNREARFTQLRNAVANWANLTAAQKDTILKVVLTHLLGT